MIRILLLADTHLGLDFPLNPRVDRRRRGDDFFSNFDRALQPAMDRDVDLVVHGGDLFYRSKVPIVIVQKALEPLVAVAERDVPVFLVPGNHERSKIPLHLWTSHPRIHIFHRPETFYLNLNETSLSVSGFPFIRSARDDFALVLDQTRYKEKSADVRILCMHQIVEGAQVGSSNYTFRSGPEVIRGEDVPGDFAAILSGHVHRSQTLRKDLAGQQLKSPVIYPGSVERTSFAECNEVKHYVRLQVTRSEQEGGKIVDLLYEPLPSRPMITLEVTIADADRQTLEEELRSRLADVDPDAVVRVHVHGDIPLALHRVFNAENLRTLAPESVNVSISYDTRVKLRGQIPDEDSD
ncbi:MAG: metallophosphoesterase [Anaerolineales bacterium]|nr:metallophosphoesterase [Anaerolineales bacterium]